MTKDIKLHIRQYLQYFTTKRNICFIDNSNINPRYNCNKSGIHLNKSGNNKLIEHMLLFALSKLEYSHIAQVSVKYNIFSEIINCKRKKLSSTKIKNRFKTMRDLRSKYLKNVFLGHLNINSLRNKFESVNKLIKDTFNIFLLSESKLDSTFPDSQFSAFGHRIIKKDRNKNS